MFKREWAAHCLMALGALRGLPAKLCLTCRVGIVTTGTGGATFLNRMMRTHVEFRENILVTGGTQCSGSASFFLIGVEVFNLGRVDAMAVATLDAGLVMLGNGEMHAPFVRLVTTQALCRLRLAWFDVLLILGLSVSFSCRMARCTVAVLHVGLGFRVMAFHALFAADERRRFRHWRAGCGLQCKRWGNTHSPPKYHSHDYSQTSHDGIAPLSFDSSRP